MDKLQAMQVFARVVEAGTFTKAADSLALPKPTVTRLVQTLEAHLQTKLLNRTTRRVTVTADGAAYYDRAVRVLERSGRARIDDVEGQGQPARPPAHRRRRQRRPAPAHPGAARFLRPLPRHPDRPRRERPPGGPDRRERRLRAARRRAHRPVARRPPHRRVPHRGLRVTRLPRAPRRAARIRTRSKTTTTSCQLLLAPHRPRLPVHVLQGRRAHRDHRPPPPVGERFECRTSQRGWPASASSARPPSWRSSTSPAAHSSRCCSTGAPTPSPSTWCTRRTAT